MTDTILIFDTTCATASSPRLREPSRKSFRSRPSSRRLARIIEAASQSPAPATSRRSARSPNCASAHRGQPPRALLRRYRARLEAVRHAQRPRILPSSPPRRFICGSSSASRRRGLEAVDRSVRLARNLVDDVEWRRGRHPSEPDFSPVASRSRSMPAPRRSPPRTPSATTPETYGAMFTDMISRVPNSIRHLSTLVNNDRGSRSPTRLPR